MKPLNAPPFCCTKEAIWINNGRDLKYYFCKVCKLECVVDEIHLVGSIRCHPVGRYCVSRTAYLSLPIAHYWDTIDEYKHRMTPCKCGASKIRY